MISTSSFKPGNLQETQEQKHFLITYNFSRTYREKSSIDNDSILLSIGKTQIPTENLNSRSLDMNSELLSNEPFRSAKLDFGYQKSHNLFHWTLKTLKFQVFRRHL
jgi:hypothetical protein